MNDLHTIAAELAEAQADLALFQRLTSAPDRVKRLTADHAKAQAAAEKAEAQRVAAEREARFKNLSNIRVTDISGAENPNLINRRFKITYTKVMFDSAANRNLPRQVGVVGFQGLEPSALEFLIEKHPEEIPEDILALAPGDPYAAFRTYFAGRRRGYFNGKVSA